jgi:hypothetical protein
MMGMSDGKERGGWAEIVVDSGGEVKSRWEADVPAQALSRFVAALVWFRAALTLSEGSREIYTGTLAMILAMDVVLHDLNELFLISWWFSISHTLYNTSTAKYILINMPIGTI